MLNPSALDTPRQWETALEAVNDGVCLLGADGSIRRCNPAAATALRRTEEDLIDKPADAIIASAFGQIHPERVAYLDKNPRPQTVEVDRDRRRYRLTIVPVLDDEGELTGSVLTIADIPEHHRLLQEERALRLRASETEELRQHADRLSSLDQLKSQFLRLVSHELRGPVGVLAGYLSMLQDGSLGELPEPARASMPTMLAKLAEMNLL